MLIILIAINSITGERICDIALLERIIIILVNEQDLLVNIKVYVGTRKKESGRLK